MSLPESHGEEEVVPASPDTRADPAILDRLQEQLTCKTGRQYWRSLEELADSPELYQFLAAEFPAEAPAWSDAMGRRRFLQLMAGSLALAGVSACTRQPTEKIYPYVKAPEQIVPGEPLFYATAMPLVGMGTGLLVESHLGRPTKIEGNRDHPASLGATDVLAQASVLTLYDPDRSQVITFAGEIRPWAAFTQAMADQLTALQATEGRGLCVLTGAVTSPTLASQMNELLTRLPNTRWFQYEPLARDSARRGARLAYGRDVDVHYQLDRADVVVSLDADFIMNGPARTRDMRALSRRRQAHGDTAMNRLYVVESTPSNTGAVADHRLPLRPRDIETFAQALASRLGLSVTAPPNAEHVTRWVEAVARDLQAHRGRCVVIPGDFQPASAHILAHAMNAALGNLGQTVVCTDPVEAQPEEHGASLRSLVEAIDGGAVTTLMILGTNPVLTAPADLAFADRLDRVPLRIHLGLYDDETARHCHWHVPEAHFLESWSDVRAFDGTTSILQPLIAPLYDGRTVHEVIALLSSEPRQSSYEIVRAHWQERWGEAELERRWRRAVHDGVVADSALPPLPVTLRADWAGAVDAERKAERATETGTEGGLDLVVRPDPHLLDGSFANNAWLQELPRPMTKLTWDNAALVAPATAARLGLVKEQVVELEVEGRVVRAPIWLVPGQAADVVTVHIGHGRQRAGRVGNGSGFNAYVLRSSAAPWSASGLQLRATAERHPLATTQHHHAMEGREPVRVRQLGAPGEAGHDGHGNSHGAGDEASLHPPFEYSGHAWGMSIDLNRCTGCNACMIACQSENNIAVVGKDDVIVGRDMHWIRVDRYFEGEPDNPAIYHQPVPCMHCERAPCEVVCPVNATVHGEEGLNEMVYNRCVGTRYCANNCPYKVRRFNFRLYSDWDTEPLKMRTNPDVTVRSRGVMEKCTYCVQRINYASIRANREDRTLRDGEIVTACQAACPAEAIVFGDINDKNSAVSARRADPRHYALLAELGTKPRTTYLSVIRNPNPDLEGAA